MSIKGRSSRTSLVMRLFFVVVSFASLTSFSYAKTPMVPAMYVFGDSLVDVGNNNYIPLSLIKADFPFNGIDFPNKMPTGRFSNGKNAADFIAEKLGLPSSPPFLSMLWQKDNDKSLATGVNFASGGGGILNGTGQTLGFVIPLTQQLDHYMTVYDDLVRKSGSDRAKQHLSKSLFLVLTGSNDILGYGQSTDLRKKYTPQQYVDLLVSTIKGQIERLHSYGARKFLFPGLATLGCIPVRRLASKTDDCDEDLNSWSRQYNEGFQSMLKQLKSELPDMNYMYFDTYGVLQKIIQKPDAYGFTEVKAACCGLGKLKAEVPCIPISKYCSDRKDHVFWDLVHPTEATDRFLVNTIYKGVTEHSMPINMTQLLAL